MSQYEVRCQLCDVSFPPGTKRCLYCGERTSSDPRIREPEAAAVFQQLLEREAPERVTGQPQPSPAEIEEEEATPSLRRSLPRSIGSLVWIFLLVAVSIYRGCSEG